MLRHVLLSTVLGALGSQIVSPTTLGSAVGRFPHQHVRHGWGRREKRTAEAFRTLHLRGAGSAKVVAGDEEGKLSGGTDRILGKGCPGQQRLMLAWNLHHEYRGLNTGSGTLQPATLEDAAALESEELRNFWSLPSPVTASTTPNPRILISRLSSLPET